MKELFEGRENGEITSEEGARETQIIARAHKVRGGPTLNRRDGARPRAPALGFRHPAEGKHVRRYHLRPSGRIDQRYGFRTFSRYW